MAVVELVVERATLQELPRSRYRSLSSVSLPSPLSLSDSSSLALPLPPSLPPSLLYSLSYRRFPPRLPVLPPPDDSLLHEKSGRSSGRDFFTLARRRTRMPAKVFVCSNSFLYTFYFLTIKLQKQNLVGVPSLGSFKNPH